MTEDSLKFLLDSYVLALLSCVFCAFLSAAAQPRGFTRSEGTNRETLKASGGPRLSEGGLWSAAIRWVVGVGVGLVP